MKFVVRIMHQTEISFRDILAEPLVGVRVRQVISIVRVVQIFGIYIRKKIGNCPVLARGIRSPCDWVLRSLSGSRCVDTKIITPKQHLSACSTSRRRVIGGLEANWFRVEITEKSVSSRLLLLSDRDTIAKTVTRLYRNLNICVQY